MTIEKSDIPIPEPCHADWDAMRGQDTRRFCDHCAKDVHYLSSMTRDEAMKVLARRDEHLCVRYAHVDGAVQFKDSTSPVWRLSRQLEGARKLLAAAALIVPMLAACDSSRPDAQPDTQPEAVSPEVVAPISLDAGGASLELGAGTAPSFDGQPEEHAAHQKGEAPMAKDPEGAHETVDECDEPDAARPPTKGRRSPFARSPESVPVVEHIAGGLPR